MAHTDLVDHQGASAVAYPGREVPEAAVAVAVHPDMVPFVLDVGPSSYPEVPSGQGTVLVVLDTALDNSQDASGTVLADEGLEGEDTVPAV